MRIEQKRKNGMEWERKDGNRIGQENQESNSIGRIGSKQGKGVNGKKKGQEGWDKKSGKKIGPDIMGRIKDRKEKDRKQIGQVGLAANMIGK